MNNRRATDRLPSHRTIDVVDSPSAEIDNHKMLYAIYQDVQTMKEKLHNMEGMFAAWSNIKGLRNSAKWIGLTILFLSAVIGALAGAWYAFKRAVAGL